MKSLTVLFVWFHTIFSNWLENGLVLSFVWLKWTKNGITDISLPHLLDRWAWWWLRRGSRGPASRNLAPCWLGASELWCSRSSWRNSIDANCKQQGSLISSQIFGWWTSWNSHVKVTTYVNKMAFRPLQRLKKKKNLISHNHALHFNFFFFSFTHL